MRRNQIKETERLRAFGKDITNIHKGSHKDEIRDTFRPLKNNLMMEKQPKKDAKQPSFIQKPQKDENNSPTKDAIEDYHADIIRHMIDIEEQLTISQHYFPPNSQITIKMKQILIDWLVDVHDSFKLKEETLYLALVYLNEYESKIAILKENYQLVGITCLWIASKYEEIYPPRIKNYIDVTAGTYTLSDLKRIEGKIIETMNFQLNKVTPLALLRLFQMTQMKEQFRKNLSLSKYILESSYQNIKIPQEYNGLIMCLASVKLSDAVFKTKTSIKNMKDIAKLKTVDIHNCYKEMCLLLQNHNAFGLTAVKRKFFKECYHKVAKYKIQA